MGINLNYLEKLDEVVHLPSSFRAMLKKEYSYMWNCYFFTNDLGVISFLTLISPNLVLNYHELVIAPDK